MVPSAGYGPFVSSGISPTAVPEVAAADSVVAPTPVVHAASAATPPAPSSPSIPRRLSTVRMSKAAPWSMTSSPGRSSSRPWYAGPAGVCFGSGLFVIGVS